MATQIRRKSYLSSSTTYLHVRCNGTETSLLQCHRWTTFGSQLRVVDAGVNCAGMNHYRLVVATHQYYYVIEKCTEVGDVRLTRGATSREGTIEICIDGLWGTVCDDGLDVNDAQVVCRQLGFPIKGTQPKQNYY